LWEEDSFVFTRKKIFKTTRLLWYQLSSFAGRRQWQPAGLRAFLKGSFFTFCLDAKSNKKVKAPEKWLKIEAWACTKRNSPEESFGRIGVPAQAVVLCLRDDCVVSPTAQPSIFFTPFF